MYILIIEKIAFADGLDIGQGKDRREKERKEGKRREGRMEEGRH